MVNETVNAVPTNFNLTIPAFAAPGDTYARFRFSSAGGLSYDGPADDGEVEDYQVEILRFRDYGDAPNSYPTTRAEDGAAHENFGPMLGTERDEELNGTHSAAADADDTTGTPDDENGVTFPAVIMAGMLGATTQVTVTGGPAKLDAWIDFNGDGSWDGAGERIFNSVDITSGVHNLTITAKSGWISVMLPPFGPR